MTFAYNLVGEAIFDTLGGQQRAGQGGAGAAARQPQAEIQNHGGRLQDDRGVTFVMLALICKLSYCALLLKSGR